MAINSEWERTHAPRCVEYEYLGQGISADGIEYPMFREVKKQPEARANQTQGRR